MEAPWTVVLTALCALDRDEASVEVSGVGHLVTAT